MEEPQSQLQLQVTDCRERRIIGKIRDFLFSQASAIDPSVIERRIQELFTSFETPTHPPYALMIQNAVKDLNERNGSTEEAISEFIKNEFQDLPWAHSRILGLHLGKLCRAEELFRTASGRYMIMDDYVKFDERQEKGWRVGRRRKKNKREINRRGGETLERIGADRCNELNKRENEEQDHLSESHGTGTNESTEEQGKSEIGLRMARCRYMLTDDYDKLEEQGWRVGRRRKKHRRGRSHRGGETMKRTEGADELHKNEQNHLSKSHDTGTNETIEEHGKYETGQLGVTEVCHGHVVQGQGESETQQSENTDERIQETIIDLKDKISSSKIMNTEPHMVEKQDSMVIKFRIPCEKQLDNLGGGETLERTEGAERCNELHERENEEENHLSELHGTGANEMIEEQGNSEIEQLGVTEVRHGWVFQGQSEEETQQNENTNDNLSASLGSPTIAENQCEDQPDIFLAVVENQPLTQQIEATTEVSRFCSDEISNNENLRFSLGSPTIAENQCENQPDNLLAVIENQSLTQQIEATTELLRFCSDEISDNDYLSASLGSPTVSVIPKEKLQIPEQEEQHQNETSVQQIFSGACELLVDQEGPINHMETICSSLPTEPYLPVDLASDSWNCLMVPISPESLEHRPSEGMELTQTQFLAQTSKSGTSETDLHTATNMLASMTVHRHKQPRDDMLGSPKGRVEENSTFGDLEKHMPMPQWSEWQPNGKSFVYCPEVSWLPSYDSIVDKRNPRYCKIKKQLQLIPKGQGWGRGRGRSYKLDGNPNQHKEQLKLPDQTPTSVSFPSLEPNEINYSLLAPDVPAASNLQQLVDSSSEESPGCIMGETALQLELQMSWNRLVYGGTTSQMEDSLSSMNGLEDKPQHHMKKRGPKRKLNLGGKTEFEHLEQQLAKRRCRGRPPNPGSTKDCSWSCAPVVPSNNCIHSGKKNQISTTLRNTGSCSPGATEAHGHVCQ